MSALITELRDSVAFTAGQGYQNRCIAERLRNRASLLEQMPGPQPRAVVRELRRFADEIEAEPA